MHRTSMASRGQTAVLIALLSCGCDPNRTTESAATSSLTAHGASTASQKTLAPTIEPTAWPGQGDATARCGIATPRDGSTLKADGWQKTSVTIVTPGWKKRGPRDLVRLVLDDFPALTLAREATTATLGKLSGGANRLTPGLHTVFAYPIDEHGRHPRGAMVGVTRFWIGTPARRLAALADAQYVRLSSPTDWTVRRGEPTALDVVLFGTNLVDDALDVRISLRGAGEASLSTSEWSPLRLSGLGPGQYELEARLVTAQGYAGAAHSVALTVK